MSHSEERVELALLKTILRKLDRIEDELEELEVLHKPPAHTTYPRTAAILVS